MNTIKISVLQVTALVLAGCGSYTPDIQEFWGSPKDATIKVNKVSAQVVCELRRAVQQVFWDNKNNPPIFSPNPDHPAPKPRDLNWFEKWGVQVTLTLDVAENTSISPGVTSIRILPNAVTSFPVGGDVVTPQSVATSLGGSVSSTATRTDKLNMFFTVKELKYGKPSIEKSCIPNKPANADLFVQSDLKIYDWLSAALLPYDTEIINYPNNSTAQNAISHEIKFEIVSGGSITPTWTLVRFTANTSGTLFAAGRNRSQDLTITFGPIEDGGGKGYGPAGQVVRARTPAQLATPAENSHLASQIGLAVSEALKTPR